MKEKKGVFVDEIETQIDEYKVAINEAVARELASIAYYYSQVRHLNN